ncbi:MAG: hypothetical protein ACLQU2_31175 [Candidatus Binataceae bacterium]
MIPSLAYQGYKYEHYKNEAATNALSRCSETITESYGVVSNRFVKLIRTVVLQTFYFLCFVCRNRRWLA